MKYTTTILVFVLFGLMLTSCVDKRPAYEYNEDSETTKIEGYFAFLFSNSTSNGSDIVIFYYTKKGKLNSKSFDFDYELYLATGWPEANEPFKITYNDSGQPTRWTLHRLVEEDTIAGTVSEDGECQCPVCPETLEAPETPVERHLQE